MGLSDSNKITKIKTLIKRFFFIFRVIFLFTVLGIVLIYIYLSTYGLPGPIKRVIESSIKGWGTEVTVGDIAFILHKGIVLRDLKFKTLVNSKNLLFEAEQVEIVPNLDLLLKKQFKLNEFKVINGQIYSVSSYENQIVLNNFGLGKINAEINILEPKKIIKANLKTHFSGIPINLNADAGNIKISEPAISENKSLIPGNVIKNIINILDNISNYISGIKIEMPSNIRVNLSVNTKTNNKTVGNAVFYFEGISNKYGRFKNIYGELQLYTDTGSGKKPITINVKSKIGSMAFNDIILQDIEAVSEQISLFDKKGDEVKLKYTAKNGSIYENDINNISGTIILTNSIPDKNKGYIIAQGTIKEIKGKKSKFHSLEYKIDSTLLSLTNDDGNVNIELSAVECELNKVKARNFKLEAVGRLSLTAKGYYNGSAIFIADHLNYNDITITKPVLNALVDYSFTNKYPEKISGQARASVINSKNMGAKDVVFQFILVPFKNRINVLSDKDNFFTPHNFSCVSSAKILNYKDYYFTNVTFNAKWFYPYLEISNFNFSITNCNLNARCKANITNGDVKLNIDGNTGFESIKAIMPSKTHKILESINVGYIDKMSLEIESNMKNITNITDLTSTELLNESKVKGFANILNVNYQGLKYDSIWSDFIYSNNVIGLKELHLNGENKILITNSTVNLNNSMILLNYDSQITKISEITNIYSKANEVIALIEIKSPSHVSGTLSVIYTNINTLSLYGKAELTNVLIRGKAIKSLVCSYYYGTNRAIFNNVEVIRKEGIAKAKEIVADFDKQTVFIDNAEGKVDFTEFTTMISPEVETAMKPYRFSAPPYVRAKGTVPMRGSYGDIQFNVYAPAFKWEWISAKEVTSRILWKGLTLTITNVTANFHNGRLNGNIYIDFEEKGLTNLYFNVEINNVNVRSLLIDLDAKSKNIEGFLSGRLVVSSSKIEDYRLWCGQGQATIEDGLIWDIPVFGIFSPVLNMVSPGLGNSRANYGSATFIITNGVISSTDLEIRSKAVRLHYEGTLNLEKQINARVEAEVLRDMWVIGPAIRLMLKPLTTLFIYKVSGTIDNPILEPLFIPKFMVMPFHPFRTLKNFFFPKLTDEKPGSQSLPSRSDQKEENNVK